MSLSFQKYYVIVHIFCSIGVFIFQYPAPEIIVLKTLLAVRMEQQYINTALIGNALFHLRLKFYMLNDHLYFFFVNCLFDPLSLFCARVFIFLKFSMLHFLCQVSVPLSIWYEITLLHFPGKWFYNSC